MASSDQSSTYHIGFKQGTIKLFELRNVSTCLQYLLPTLNSLPPTFSLLDVGCGPGSITLDLARHFPQATIIGVDQSAEVTERNQASVEALAPGTCVEFRQGDILRPETFLTPAEMEAKFDVVHEHTTLICIPESAPVLRQMRLLAKPKGGIVACRDGDTQSQVLWPPCPQNAELQERIYRMNGLETQTGRRLINKALGAGFRRDQITASASVLSNITPEERFAYAGSMLDILADENSEYRRAAAKFGYTAEQIDVLRANMQRFIDAEDAWRLTATFGRRHREPVAGVGNIPTRGEALYICVLSFLNIILWLGPYTIHQPQASFTSLKMQSISIIGNRAGVMAMGNFVALFLFAARNNVLLYLTDWSYSTYLLLHRWLAYWAIFHTIVHSFMLLANYVLQGTYEAELARQYWIWGIVGTVAVSAILPFSLLWVRRRFYEFFLASHVVLSLLFIVGYYYHIWYVYEYNWGYEIWIFIAGGIWGADRLFRLVRTFWQGLRWANITTVDDVDGEYIRIEVEGKRLDGGVVYLGFPTLSWRFWETHPFSVAYSGLNDSIHGSRTPESPVSTPVRDDKAEAESPTVEADPEKGINAQQDTISTPARGSTDTTVFYSRTRSGMTRALAAKASPSTRIRVLLEGPYEHSGHVSAQIAHCTDMICIAGGVGITACLPFVRSRPAAGSTSLFWSSRHQGLITALAPAIQSLPGSVKVETAVGERLKLDEILAKELTAGSGGALAVVVCGPPSMADDVRCKIVEIMRNDSRSRPYVLVDEAFAW
ncbi:ferric reductase transmembrane component 4 [Colletotrichum camelliae]|nr:ferric reductase transmembrane component 4 [Colletotrichum camelliae]